MSEHGWGSIILTRPGSIVYFGGVFCPWRSAIVLGQTGEPTLVTCGYDAERIRALTWISDILGWLFSEPSEFIDKIVLSLKDRGVSEGVVGAELDIAHAPGILSAKEMLDLRETLPKINIKNALEKINEMMLIKDDYEIEQLRRAAEVADIGMREGLNALRPGISEFSILGVIEKAMRDAGSMFTWSVTGNEIGSGYRQRYRDCFTVMPSNKIIQYNDLVTIDIHPMISGYLSDLALNAVIGPPIAPVKRLAEGWEEIVEILIDALSPKRTVHDVACAVENAVQKRKLDKFCIPFYGHGLGADARIPPIVIKGNQQILQPRMVVVAVLQITDPNVGGLRLEVPVLLREKGNEVLCKIPLKLHVCDGI
ncbi:aminopeptidase P family protein [bacterium]|nr:aminopeptidase P family protein [bacterium]